MNVYAIIFACLFFVSGIANTLNLPSSQQETLDLIIHNRPLVKVNGKTISVIDVKKKMDLFLQEHHPESFASNLLVYQFYVQQWRTTLQEMIDNELIKMQASSFKFNISDGDVREEMEKRFGPNVVKRLDELQLTYDEAKQIVHDDITLRYMQWFKVWAKTLQKVTPELIKSQYESYLAGLPLKDEWTYKVASVRGKDNLEENALKAYQILLKEEIPKDTKQIKGITGFLPPSTSLNISDPITVSTKDLTPETLQILQSLPFHTFSKPIEQTSKDGSTLYRMFYILDHKQDPTPPFEELSSKIYDTLVQKYGEIQQEEYLEKLRKRFLSEDLVVKNLFPANYQPFAIRGS